MADAKGAFQSKCITIARGNDLSFISEGRGFEIPRTDEATGSPGAR
jgi:hypothetical protein